MTKAEFDTVHVILRACKSGKPEITGNRIIRYKVNPTQQNKPKSRFNTAFYVISIMQSISVKQRTSENSSKLISNPSQIAYKVFNFTEVLHFFLMEDSVVCGTPLRSDNSYFVIFRSMHNCSMRNATASSKSILPPLLNQIKYLLAV